MAKGWVHREPDEIDSGAHIALLADEEGDSIAQAFATSAFLLGRVSKQTDTLS